MRHLPRAMYDRASQISLRDIYGRGKQQPVEPDMEAVRRVVSEVIVDNLLAVSATHFVRHDAAKLLRAIVAAPTNVASLTQARTAAR